MFSVTSKAPNLERLTSEMGLDKGYFDRIYGTFLLWLCYIKNKIVTTILLVVFSRAVNLCYIWLFTGRKKQESVN